MSLLLALVFQPTPPTPEPRGGGYADPYVIRWWLNKHKKKKVETVEQAVELVQEVIQREQKKPAPSKQVQVVSNDYALQLEIAKRILNARLEIKRLEDEEEEEAMLALMMV